jgi:hypothetical protein
MFARRYPLWARDGTPFRGNRYSTVCAFFGRDGGILGFEEGRKEGRVVFRFRNEPQPKTLPGLLYGLVRLPEFVIYDPDGKEVVRIRRTRRLPRAIFEMKDGKELRATIVRRLRHPSGGWPRLALQAAAVYD